MVFLVLLTATLFVVGRQAQPRRERRPLRDLSARDVLWTALAGVVVIEHLHEVWVTRGGPGTARSSASSA